MNDDNWGIRPPSEVTTGTNLAIEPKSIFQLIPKPNGAIYPPVYKPSITAEDNSDIYSIPFWTA